MGAVEVVRGYKRRRVGPWGISPTETPTT